MESREKTSNDKLKLLVNVGIKLCVFFYAEKIRELKIYTFCNYSIYKIPLFVSISVQSIENISK